MINIRGFDIYQQIMLITFSDDVDDYEGAQGGTGMISLEISRRMTKRDDDKFQEIASCQ